MRKLIDEADGKLNSHVVQLLDTLIPGLPLGTGVLIAKTRRAPLMVGYMGGDQSEDTHTDKETAQRSCCVFDKFKRKINPTRSIGEENGLRPPVRALGSSPKIASGFAKLIIIGTE